MSRRGKSDAQLDAEAAVPQRNHPSVPPLTAWRAAAAAEPPLRLTALHPALIRDEDGNPVIEGTKVGADLTQALLSYLDGSGGRLYPLHDAVLALERWCRRTHVERFGWSDHHRLTCQRDPCTCGGWALCAAVAWRVIGQRLTLLDTAEACGITYPRTVRLLNMGLAIMRRKQARWLEDTEVSATHDREACARCRAEDGLPS